MNYLFSGPFCVVGEGVTLLNFERDSFYTWETKHASLAARLVMNSYSRKWALCNYPVAYLLSIASFYATESSFMVSIALSITCFDMSFTEFYIYNSPTPFCELPTFSKSPENVSILIDVTREVH